ncbi:MAG: hypothetical protein NT120_03090 [Candidatus Aenigmarchaeota archaeon]|nr:hypothetical protein [Candidatus Aenigmarchaeota archaeon]
MHDTDKIEEMEKSITTIAEYVKSQIGEMKRSFVGRDEVESLKEKVHGNDSEGLMNRIQDLEDEIRDLKRMKPVEQDVNELKKEMQRDISDLKFEYDKKMMRHDKDLEELNNTSKILEPVNRQIRDLEQGIKDLRGRPMPSFSEMKDLQKRTESLEGIIRTNDVPHENEKLNQIENELRLIKKMGDTKPIILASFKQEMEKELIRLRQDFDARLKTYEDRTTGDITSDDKRLEQDIEDLRKRIQNIQNNDGVEKQLRELRIKVRGLEQMPHIVHDGEDLKRSLDEEQINRMSLEKHVQDLRKEMDDIKSTPSTVNNPKIRQELDALKKTVNEMRFAAGKKSSGANEEVIDDINDLKHAMDEEIANRMSIDKHLQDLQQQVREAKKPTETNIDYSKIIKQMQEDKPFSDEVDKKSRLETMKLITKQLEEYTRMLEKRMPNLATRDDLVKMERKIDQRLRLPIRMEEETIGRRMDDLEVSMNTLISVLRSLQNSNKNPFVIE